MNATGELLRLIEANTGYTSTRASTGDRPDEAYDDVSTGVDALENTAGGLPGSADMGGPYAVKGGSLGFYAVKSAAHQHERMEERTPFHRSHADIIQRAVDYMDLAPGAYHLPLRDKAGVVVGFAQFKGVPNRKKPVLATVLGATMKPSGKDLESMLKLSMSPESNAEPCEVSSRMSDDNNPRIPEPTRRIKATGDPKQEDILRRAFNNVGTSGPNETIESTGLTDPNLAR